MRLPILGVESAMLPERVLVVGDPARAVRAAALLEGAAELARSREYVTLVGEYGGRHIGIVSHGVGAPGAGVCFEELFRAGVRRVIRAGTCGGMQPDIDDGDLVIVTGAVRDDGLTDRLVPMSYPALAAPDVVVALRRAHGDSTFREGIALTSALFYPGEVLGSDLVMWQRAGVIVVEMECAALLVSASLHGAEAGAILAVDGNPLRDRDDDMAGYDPNRAVVADAVSRMLTIALDALVR